MLQLKLSVFHIRTTRGMLSVMELIANSVQKLLTVLWLWLSQQLHRQTTIQCFSALDIIVAAESRCMPLNCRACRGYANNRTRHIHITKTQGNECHARADVFALLREEYHSHLGAAWCRLSVACYHMTKAKPQTCASYFLGSLVPRSMLVAYLDTYEHVWHSIAAAKAVLSEWALHRGSSMITGSKHPRNLQYLMSLSHQSAAIF